MTADAVEEPSPAAAAAAASAALDREVVAATPFDEGMNAVYRVSVADGQDAVLKVGTVTEGPRLLSGPLLLERVARETSIPVPEVLAGAPAEEGPLDRAHFLMAYVDGRTTTDVLELSPAAHERLVREAGRHLAQLHDLPFDGPYGRLFAVGGELTVQYGTESWGEAFRREVDPEFGGVDDRFADLEPEFLAALDAFEATVDEDRVDGSILYADYHPKNLVFEPDDDADPLVRAVLDFNFRPFGDAPLDVAIAEANLVDLPLGGTDRAEHLRGVLRDSYVAARDGTHEEHFDGRYPYYRLCQPRGYLKYFDYFAQFAREDDPDAVAERLWTFVRDRVEEVDG